MGERWTVWIDDGPEHRSFASLARAEQCARKIARGGKPVEINRNRTVAYVRLDALDRVWTDVRETSLL